VKILSYTLYITLLKILVSIPTLHASQRESSCSSTSSGTITTSSQQNTQEQRLQRIRTNIMNFTLSDLREEKKNEEQAICEKNRAKPQAKNTPASGMQPAPFKRGQLVANLRCGHSFRKAALNTSMKGRAEGELPKCPVCHKTFEMDEVTYTKIVEEKEL
jgi:hypothetical protein